MDRANLVGYSFCRGKNDYKAGGTFCRSFLPPKIKCCSSIEKLGVIEYQKTFQRFNDNERLLDRSQCFKLIESESMSAMLLKS